MKTLKDGMTLQLLDTCIDQYINTFNFEKKINTKLKKKKIRTSNLPSHISENIVKFLFCYNYGFMPSWDTDRGDLIINNGHNKELRIEVKGSIDLFKGPPTFGPTESWDVIYFVDCKNILNKKVKVYEIFLSNKNEKWQNLKVNKKETYRDHCKQKRRHRISFIEIIKQLKNDCKLLFNGHISELGQF